MAYRTHLHGDLGWQATLITAASISPSLCRSHATKHSSLSIYFLLAQTRSPQLNVIIITVVAHEECFDVRGYLVQCTVGMEDEEGGVHAWWVSLNHQDCMNMKADTMCSQKKKADSLLLWLNVDWLVRQQLGNNDKIICPQTLAAVKLMVIQIKGVNTQEIFCATKMYDVHMSSHPCVQWRLIGIVWINKADLINWAGGFN